jgi:glutamate synthase (NADPH) large chain
MGTDTPLAVLSDRPRLLFDYFQQLFAQVTNPPLDAIREELVTSMAGHHRPRGNLLEPGPESCRQIVLPRPDPHQRGAGQDPLRDEDARARRTSAPSRSTGCTRSPRAATACAAPSTTSAQVSAAIEDGATIIVLSDRYSNAELAPIPSLLLTAAVHHHLIREKTRTKVGLVVETGDAREVHHMAC